MFFRAFLYKVIQQTAAKAEETASASEKMNAQAEQLKDYVNSLASLISGTDHTAGARHLSKCKVGGKTSK